MVLAQRGSGVEQSGDFLAGVNMHRSSATGWTKQIPGRDLGPGIISSPKLGKAPDHAQAHSPIEPVSLLGLSCPADGQRSGQRAGVAGPLGVAGKASQLKTIPDQGEAKATPSGQVM